MLTHHPSLNQPDLITTHVEFVSRTRIGPATVSLTPVKLGRQFSTIRAQLLQQQSDDSKPNSSPSPRVCLEALITQGKLDAEEEDAACQNRNAARGRVVDLPVRNLEEKFLVPKREACEPWAVQHEWRSRRPAAFKIDVRLPPASDSLAASPTYGPSVREQWVRWAPESGTAVFTVASLPFLADCFRPLPEAYRLRGHYWYATLNYGVEVRRGPPPVTGGWEWLFVRVEMSDVRGSGRYGMDVWILDEWQRLVARSWHTALIMQPPVEKNNNNTNNNNSKI
jgi:hypothetical protein